MVSARAKLLPQRIVLDINFFVARLTHPGRADVEDCGVSGSTGGKVSLVEPREGSYSLVVNVRD